MIRASRSKGPGDDLYIPGTAVVLSETLKLIGSLALITAQEKSLSGLLKRLQSDIIDQPITTLKIMVPAGLYTLQNTLQYMAATYLDAATFQVTYQLKVLTTALFSVILLGKRLSFAQWLSLVLLTGGVALIQMPDKAAVTTSTPAERLLGFIMIITACFSSGFAGVYFEKVLKGETAGVWVLNVQLAGFGIIIALTSLLFSHYERIKDQGFFAGYNNEVYIAICLQAFGGLIVAVVVKYADNILKGFATSISIILSAIISFMYFDFVITNRFGIGAFFVIASTVIYSKFRPAQQTKTLPVTSKTEGNVVAIVRT